MNGVMRNIKCHKLQKSRKNHAVKQKEAEATAKQKTRSLTIIIITKKTGRIHMENKSIENGAAVRQVIAVWTQDSQFLLKMVRISLDLYTLD